MTNASRDSHNGLIGTPHCFKGKKFENISVGETGEFTQVYKEEFIGLFAALSGDYNPIHMDKDFAHQSVFRGRIGHGMWCAALLSGAVASVLPGPGTIYRSQTIKFLNPIRINDELTARLKVEGKNNKTRLIAMSCTVVNQRREKIATGMAEVIAPTMPG